MVNSMKNGISEQVQIPVETVCVYFALMILGKVWIHLTTPTGRGKIVEQARHSIDIKSRTTTLNSKPAGHGASNSNQSIITRVGQQPFAPQEIQRLHFVYEVEPNLAQSQKYGTPNENWNSLSCSHVSTTVGCITWTLTKCLEKKLDGNYRRMLLTAHLTNHPSKMSKKTLAIARDVKTNS